MLLQTLGIVGAWLLPAVLHIGNNGLWFQGDAGRHAITGLFWWDFLMTFPLQPSDYVLSYYARYPAITPLSYPPAFYLLEGAAFRVLGPSPFVAKWLVLCFALVACLYVAAWLRRYVAIEAGWGGALLALQPGVVTWSNAIMLNIPSMTLGLMALYHARRWLEQPSPRHLLLAIACAVVAALTYFPAILVAVVLCAWLVGEERARAAWRQRRGVVLLILSLLVVLALAIIEWAPLPFALALPSRGEFLLRKKWLTYIFAPAKLLTVSILVLAACALPAALLQRQWRLDVRLLALWVFVTYVGLSLFYSQSDRYALLMAPAFVILAMIGLRAVFDVARFILGRAPPRYWFAVALIGLLSLHLYVASSVRVPSIGGFREAAQFMVEAAPTERIFYEGRYDGVFTFYVRAFDPAFTRAVVRGSKLLYASAILPTWRLSEKVSSPSQVVDLLKDKCGCRWLAIERQDSDDEVNAVRLLRQALHGPEFRLVKSFPIRTPEETALDIYEFLGPQHIPDEVELPFPILGEGTVFRAKPIQR